MKYPLFNSNAWIGLQEVPGRVQRHEIKLEIKMRGKHSPEWLWIVRAVWWWHKRVPVLFFSVDVCVHVKQLA